MESASGSGRIRTFHRIDNGHSGPDGGSFLAGTAAANPGEKMSSQEISRIEKAAYTKGFAEGEKAGLETGNRRVTPVIENFGHALTELENVKKEIYQNAEQKTLHLAIAIARKIVSREVQSNPEVVLEIIRKALDKVVDDEDITIRLNPEDFNFINTSGQKITDGDDGFENIKLQADASIAGGGCLIETRMGNIDARIDRQFKVIEELFSSEFQKARTEAT